MTSISEPEPHPQTPRANEGEVLRIIRPEHQTLPVVFASPHSGTDYPESFIQASKLDAKALRKSEDSFIDEIYAAAPQYGAPLIYALFPRAYIDPNREPFELDPDMFDGDLPSYVNAHSPRVAAGLGTIARVVANGADIYRDKLNFSEAARRINALYRPYHRALQELIETTRQKFGWCLLIDCHSMPSIGGPMDLDMGKTRVDFVLGDCFGASCDPAISDHVDVMLAQGNHAVTRNAPYSGGYTTVHYGRPNVGVHVLQIETNRALYMNEETYERLSGIKELTQHMEALMASLADFCAHHTPTR
jgi:N-formylglutamate amidohydrolase